MYYNNIRENTNSLHLCNGITVTVSLQKEKRKQFHPLVIFRTVEYWTAPFMSTIDRLIVLPIGEKQQ